MTEDDIRARPHTVGGSDRLTGEQVRAYLEAGGYAAEADGLMLAAQRFPRTYKYTADRHRYVVYEMPGGYFGAGDCTESEERIKRLAAARRGRSRL